MSPRKPRHRGNGAGSVYKRPDGRWAAVVTVEGRRVALYSATSAEAQRNLRSLLDARERNQPLRGDRQALGDYLSGWLDDVTPDLSAQTIARYESVIRLHITPALGRLRLADVTPEAVERFYRRLQSHGLGASTITIAHAILHRALDRAERWGLVARNPTDLAAVPHLDRTGGSALSLAQARQFLVAASSDRNATLWLAAVCTGLRPGELLGLRWERVDLDRGLLVVAATAVRDGGGMRVSERTKTGRVREVPLVPELVAALRAHRLAQGTWRLGVDQGLVFPNRLGGAGSQSVMRKRLRALLASAGLPLLRPHDLRHSSASILIALGVDVVTVSAILGHSRASMTLVYGHAYDRSVHEAIGALGEALHEPTAQSTAEVTP